jgi:hypothetical protein
MLDGRGGQKDGLVRSNNEKAIMRRITPRRKYFMLNSLFEYMFTSPLSIRV